MGLFDFFRKRNVPRKPAATVQPASNPTTQARRQDDIDISDRFLRINSIDFFGPCSNSPNGRYVFGCQDFDYRGGSRGGNRESGYGRVALVDGRSLLYQADVERPNDESVANNGVAVVNDWRFGSKRNGIFYVFDRDGSKLIKHATKKANLLGCGISPEGDVAWCSVGEEDGNKLLLFSVSLPELLCKLKEPGRPEAIRIEGGDILVTIRGALRRYDRSGDLLNPKDVAASEYKHIIKHGGIYERLDLLKRRLVAKDQVPFSNEEIHEAIGMLKRVLGEKDLHAEHRARTHRMIGELAEVMGDIRTAIENYREALIHNSKVGVKTALARLEKASTGK